MAAKLNSEDIMARYLAIDEFMQGFRVDLGEQGE